jgi:hypothetical protein
MIAQEIPIEQVLLLRQKVLWPNKNLDFVRILKACICFFRPTMDFLHFTFYGRQSSSRI